MPLRKNEQQNPNHTLRRSPRFLHGNQADAGYPETPKPAEGKIRPNSFSTPLGSEIAIIQKKGSGVLKSSVSRRSARLECAANLIGLDSPELRVAENRVTRSSTRGSRSEGNRSNNCGEISKKGVREVAVSECLDRSRKGPSRSAKLNSGVSVSECVMEKKLARSSTRGRRLVNHQLSICSEITKKGNREVTVPKCSDKSSKGLSKSARLNSRAKMKPLPEKVTGSRIGLDLSEQNIGVVEKRVTRSRACAKKTRSAEVGISDAGKGDVTKVSIGEKGKRIQVEEECDFIKGWTAEQELALRRAYFTAKPTPHFWKKVARMVPGKSAEECFSRIHSDQLTPSQTQKRCRPNKTQAPSPLPYSASKLLTTPAGINTKKPKSRRKTLKTVRHLLEKQRTEDQNYKADLFSILEPTADLSVPSLNFEETTPVPNRGESSRLLTVSSSKQFSRLKPAAAFASPPVLKQIKNKALHERYIDQLHCRDAKRKAKSLRNGKSMLKKDNQVIPVKVAKDALYLDAQDGIDKLRKMEVDDADDDDDVTSGDDEMEFGDV